MKRARRRADPRRSLRRRAEERHRAKSAGTPESLVVAPERLLEELRIHQMELELQNEELRSAQRELEVSRNKYFDLFDLAPVGYVTLQRGGLILEVNLAGARLLGIERSRLVGRRFSRYVAADSQQAFYQTLSQVSNTREKRNCEASLVKHDGCPLHVVLEVSALPVGQDDLAEFRIVVADITARKGAEAALHESEEALRRSNESLKRLTNALLTAQEDERRRISRELHDSFNQDLAGVIIDLEKLTAKVPDSAELIRTRLDSMRARLGEISDAARNLAHALRPAILEHLGLKAALEAECDEFSQRQGISLRFISRGSAMSLPRDSDVALFRVVQEGLQNIAKHSHAKRASVTLVGMPKEVRVSIRDHGDGFHPEEAQLRGIGILNMKERMRLVGGRLTVNSSPGRGTQVAAAVPLPGG